MLSYRRDLWEWKHFFCFFHCSIFFYIYFIHFGAAHYQWSSHSCKVLSVLVAENVLASWRERNIKLWKLCNIRMHAVTLSDTDCQNKRMLELRNIPFRLCLAFSNRSLLHLLFWNKWVDTVNKKKLYEKNTEWFQWRHILVTDVKVNLVWVTVVQIHWPQTLHFLLTSLSCNRSTQKPPVSSLPRGMTLSVMSSSAILMFLFTGGFFTLSNVDQSQWKSESETLNNKKTRSNKANFLVVVLQQGH